jgi:hypothetical protein
MSEFVEAAVQPVLDRIDSLTASLREAAATVEQLSERISELEQGLAAQPIVCQVTVYDLDSDSFTLRQPICVNVEQYEDETIARFAEVEVYASADTEAEAIGLLKREIAGLFEELLARAQQPMGRQPQRWLTLLQTLIKHNETAGSKA